MACATSLSHHGFAYPYRRRTEPIPRARAGAGAGAAYHVARQVRCGAVRGCLPSAQPNTNHHVRRPTPYTPKSPQVSPRPHPILHPPMTTRHVSPTRARAPPPIRFSSVGTSLTDRVCAIPRARASIRAANSPHDVGLGLVLRARARACVRRVAYTSFPAASRLTHHRFHPPSPRLADLAVPIYNDQRREKPQKSQPKHTQIKPNWSAKAKVKHNCTSFLIMDKILAFSILSSSPAEIAAPGYYTRFSWRTTSAGKQQKAAAEKAPTRQQEGEKQQAGRSSPAAAAERKPVARPRFAPEFDGINCFETIVPF